MLKKIQQLLLPDTIPPLPSNQVIFSKKLGDRLNSLGYRSEEFSQRQEINVASIGCSNTYGMLIEEEERFSNIFIEKLKSTTGKSVANWNLSSVGKSNDYISRMTLNALRILHPEIVLVCFTTMDRREHFRNSYHPSTNSGCYDFILMNPLDKTPEHKHYEELSSEYNDSMNFYKNYLLVDWACEKANVKWLWGLMMTDTSPIISPLVGENNAQLFNTKKYAGSFDYIDRTKDKHPGPKSNRNLANKFWDKFLKVYGEQNVKMA